MKVEWEKFSPEPMVYKVWFSFEFDSGITLTEVVMEYDYPEATLGDLITCITHSIVHSIMTPREKIKALQDIKEWVYQQVAYWSRCDSLVIKSGLIMLDRQQRRIENQIGDENEAIWQG